MQGTQSCHMHDAQNEGVLLVQTPAWELLGFTLDHRLIFSQLDLDVLAFCGIGWHIVVAQL